MKTTLLTLVTLIASTTAQANIIDCESAKKGDDQGYYTAHVEIANQAQYGKVSATYVGGIAMYIRSILQNASVKAIAYGPETTLYANKTNHFKLLVSSLRVVGQKGNSATMSFEDAGKIASEAMICTME